MGCVLVLLALFGCACGGEPPPSEAQPLRPLLYTEAPAGHTVAPSGLEAWTDPAEDPLAWPSNVAETARHPARRWAAPGPSAHPADALSALLMALLHQDPALLDDLLFDAEGLRVAARMPADAAQREAQAIRDGMSALLTAFHPGLPTQARPEGLVHQLAPGQVELGVGRRLDGRPARPDEEVAMHWGSTITFHLLDPPHTFTLRVPRLLKDASGHWRLQAPPAVDHAWTQFRELGLHLQPRLLDAEHAPWPLSVGSFWHFRVRVPVPGVDDVGLRPQEGYRLEVARVEDHGRHRLVRLVRRPDSPLAQPRIEHWWVTPRRIYTCPRDCQRRMQDLGWLLTYASQQTPLVIFPLEPGTSWGAGGRSAGTLTHRVHHEAQTAETPAGVFQQTLVLTLPTAAGREERAFVQGLGMVRTRVTGGPTPRIEELTSWRILP